jgi:hypothetical protein
MSNVWPLSGIAVAAGLAATVVLLVLHVRRPSPRARDHGVPAALACFGVAVAMLIGAIGFGRGTAGWEKGLEHHYSDLVLPLACWAYVVWDRFSGAWRSAVGVAFLAFALASTAANSGRAFDWGREQRRDEIAFHRDLCRGDSARVLARRYSSLVFFGPRFNEQTVASGIRTLRDREQGAFDCP